MTIKVDGYDINYNITGEGKETLVVLQGWGTGLEVYDSVAAAVSDAFRVVTFDLPGFGRSDEPAEPWNVDAYADFFCKFMKALGIWKAVLLGHSYGGRIIIKLAARKKIPFTITRIVLVDSAGLVPEKTAWQKFKIQRYKLIKKIAGMKLIYALFPELIDDWRNRQGSEDYRKATPMMRACLVLAVNEDLRHLLPKIKQDVLLVWGDKDTATPLSDAKTMEELLPSCGLAVIEGTGHYSFLEKPVVFKGILRSYLGV